MIVGIGKLSMSIRVPMVRLVLDTEDSQAGLMRRNGESIQKSD